MAELLWASLPQRLPLTGGEAGALYPQLRLFALLRVDECLNR